MNITSQSLKPSLEKLRRAWQASSGPRFLAWWGMELKALLPPRWAAVLGDGAVWHLLQSEGGQWRLYRVGESAPVAQWSDNLPRAAQQERLQAALGKVEAQDRRLAWCLPAREVLRRRLLLPAAARADLYRVAGYEMDRQTPFRLEQVYYAVREDAGSAGEGRLGVELAVVPRPVLERSLERLVALGVTVDAVDVEAGSGRLGFDLLPPERVPLRRDPRRRLNLLLAAAAVILGWLCMQQWLHNRRLALEAMRTEVASMSQQAQKVGALRRRLHDSASAAGFLARRKREQVPVLAVLEELSERLPDDTWLERFNIDSSGQVGFMGQSPQAARLVDALKGAPLIGEPSFQGTIMRDPVSNKERFYMRAQLHAASNPARSHS